VTVTTTQRLRLGPLLRLGRVGTWFSPAADVLAGAAVLGHPFAADVATAAAASVLVYGSGMVLNDVADRAVDRVQRPERPIPRGDVSAAFAAVIGAAMMLGALAVSPCRWHHGLLAALVLLYDFVLKRWALVGALTMGALRGLNLLTAAAIAGGLAVSDGLLVAAVCYGLYIVAVTVLGIFEDQPTVRGRAVATVQSVPPIVACFGIATVQGGLWPAPVVAAVPALWFLRRNARRREWDQAAIRRSMHFLLLGTMLYTALLATAAGRWDAGLCIAAAILPARWIARRIALT
jgi:4-hydroxybenzoate polyprenyltransferase